MIEPYNNAATQIDRSVSSNNLTLTSSVSGDPVQPNQREYVELEIVNQSPEQAIVAMTKYRVGVHLQRLQHQM